MRRKRQDGTGAGKQKRAAWPGERSRGTCGRALGFGEWVRVAMLWRLERAALCSRRPTKQCVTRRAGSPRANLTGSRPLQRCRPVLQPRRSSSRALALASPRGASLFHHHNGLEGHWKATWASESSKECGRGGCAHSSHRVAVTPLPSLNVPRQKRQLQLVSRYAQCWQRTAQQLRHQMLKSMPKCTLNFMHSPTGITAKMPVPCGGSVKPCS
jgi:hypothetical protein